ncbi:MULTISPECIES: hypothetical protein [Streptomyces]|uniref:hypothetical protein n=1 Tax=Streptomyces TaxID=1883 RepID=UPI0029305B25|nr:hypothetical protein [Streptomyces sp. NEAU-HV9]
MNEERQGAGTELDFEAQVRGLMVEDAYLIRPSPVPYPEIRRRGVIERRRRVAVAGAVLMTLAAVPVGAYAVNGGDAAPSPAAPKPSVESTQSPKPKPTGPARPASASQLMDGITFEQAADGLTKCIDHNRAGKPKRTNGHVSLYTELGKPSDYRIILAMRATGDSNAPGDGRYVVAVSGGPQDTRLICTVKDGSAQGLNISTGIGTDTAAPVTVDDNSGKLYQQSFLDKGHWKLPFRWGLVGNVRPSVAKLTVSYGDSTAEAALDHGWYAAGGLLHQQVTKAPRVKGYDADGRLVYDSDHDKTYAKELP